MRWRTRWSIRPLFRRVKSVLPSISALALDHFDAQTLSPSDQDLAQPATRHTLRVGGES